MLERFPTALLTVMVIAAGLELASVGESLNTGGARDVEKQPEQVERKRRWTTMLVTTSLLVAFKNDGLGFVAGMLCHWSYELQEILARNSQRVSANRGPTESLDEQRSLLPQHE